MLIFELLQEFEKVNFVYLPRDENQMIDAHATLAPMFKVNENKKTILIQMSLHESPAYC